MKALVNILNIWYNELTNIMKDRGILIFIFFVPLFYPILYSYIYTNELVREVPVALVNDSHSELSRKFVRKMNASPDVVVYNNYNDMNEAYKALERRDVFGIIHIPASLDRDLGKGKQVNIGVYCEMSSMLYYKAILLTATNVSLEMNKDIKVKRYLPSTTREQENIMRTPIEYEYIPYYNTQSGFASFLIPPVLMLIIQQTLLLSIGMSMGGVRENHMGSIIPANRFYKNPFQIVAGRSLVYFMIYLVLAIYMFVFVNKWFSLPCIGEYSTFLGFIIPFLLSCIFFSIALSTFIYRREDCIMLYVFLSVPLLFLSGISWPGVSIPAIWKYISYIFPSTFGINGYVRVSSMGATLDTIRFEYIGLWIQTGVYFILSCVMYKRQIVNMVKK